MKLKEISWPVFNLGSRDITNVGDVLSVVREYVDLTTGELVTTEHIIDDKSVNGNTLGKRRLILKDAGIKLLPIDKAIYFLADLIKLSTKRTKFIDNMGRVFNYTKSCRVTLTCHKLKRIIPSCHLGVIVEVEGITQRFKLMYRPNMDYNYVGLIYFNHSYILYGMYKEAFKETYRKI